MCVVKLILASAIFEDVTCYYETYPNKFGLDYGFVIKGAVSRRTAKW